MENEDLQTGKAAMDEANAEPEVNQFLRYEDVPTVWSALFVHANDANPTSMDGTPIRLSGNQSEKTV